MREERNRTCFLHLDMSAKIGVGESMISCDLHAGNLVPLAFVDPVNNVFCRLGLLDIGIHLDIEVTFRLEITGEIVPALLNDLRIQPCLLVHWQQPPTGPTPQVCSVDRYPSLPA